MDVKDSSMLEEELVKHSIYSSHQRFPKLQLIAAEAVAEDLQPQP